MNKSKTLSSVEVRPWIQAHLALTLVWLFAALYMIFLVAPEESTMGEVQRIFYIHMPIAVVALTAYAVAFVASMAYLVKRNRTADDIAYASAEVGFIFCTCVLVTGPLWAKPVWGIWWTWDARLTSTFVLWLLFISYLMLRVYLINPDQAEVHDPGPGVVAVEDDVGRLDVAVDQAGGVGGGESVRHVGADAGGLAGIEPAFGPNPVAERRTGDERHH